MAASGRVKHTHYTKSTKLGLWSAHQLEASHKILIFGTYCQEGENYYLPWKQEVERVLPVHNKDFLLLFSILTSPHIFSWVSRESFVITADRNFFAMVSANWYWKNTVIISQYFSVLMGNSQSTQQGRFLLPKDQWSFINLLTWNLYFQELEDILNSILYRIYIYHNCLLRSNSSGRSGNVYKIAHKMINSIVVFDMNFIIWLDAEEIYEDEFSNWTWNDT